MAERTCAIDRCNRPPRARGWCTLHYQRWKSTGDPLTSKRDLRSKICAVDGCDRPRHAGGWCHMHYNRWLRTGDVGPAEPAYTPHPNPEVCTVDGCDRRARTRGWCGVHYGRWHRHGDPLAEILERQPRPEVCTIDGCVKPARARGWCSMHHARWRTHGDPNVTVVIKGDDERRFWTYVGPPEGERSCRRWRGQTNGRGYGRFSLDGRSTPAHRFALTLAGRVIPDGLEPDHCCRIRDCVEQSHIDFVTHDQNIWRRDHLSAEEHWALRPG